MLTWVIAIRRDLQGHLRGALLASAADQGKVRSAEHVQQAVCYSAGGLIRTYMIDELREKSESRIDAFWVSTLIPNSQLAMTKRKDVLIDVEQSKQGQGMSSGRHMQAKNIHPKTSLKLATHDAPANEFAAPIYPGLSRLLLLAMYPPLFPKLDVAAYAVVV